MTLPRESPLVFVAEAEATALADEALAPEDRAALEKIVHEKRRREWLLGRLAAKRAVARALAASGEAVALRDITLRPGVDGAPEAFLHGEPRPDLGLSITHGHGLGAAWVLPGGSPGIDVERVRPRPEGTFRFYLDEKERAPLLALTGDARDAAAVVLWALKEAVWKTLRPHRGVGIIDFAVFVDDLTMRESEARIAIRGAALALARTRGCSRIEARFSRDGEIVRAWARAVV